MRLAPQISHPLGLVAVGLLASRTVLAIGLPLPPPNLNRNSGDVVGSSATADSENSPATPTTVDQPTSEPHLEFAFLASRSSSGSSGSSGDTLNGRVISIENAVADPGNNGISFTSLKIGGIDILTLTTLELWQRPRDNPSNAWMLARNPHPAPEDPRLTSGEYVVMFTDPYKTSGGRLSVNFIHQPFLGHLAENEYADTYYIAIDWYNSANSSDLGRSYTPPFIFYTGGVDGLNTARAMLVDSGTDQFSDDYPRSPRDSRSNLVDPGQPGPTDVAGSGGVDPSDGTAAADGSASASPSSPILSIGAIAGIAAGCGFVVLVAFVGLLWCLIARRRRSRAAAARNAAKVDDGMDGMGMSGMGMGMGMGMDRVHDSYDAPPPVHGEYMVDKETHPRITESPHSPYSDDVGGGMPITAAAAAAPAHMPSARDSLVSAPGPSTPILSSSVQERSFTPYGDPPTHHGHGHGHYANEPPSPMQAPSAMGSPSASPAPAPAVPVAPGHDAGVPRVGSVTPHGLSRSVAALVEEGMTEEEIRRLEEEEHALDMAIEQAGRNR